jgi:hypothetical protein
MGEHLGLFNGNWAPLAYLSSPPCGGFAMVAIWIGRRADREEGAEVNRKEEIRGKKERKKRNKMHSRTRTYEFEGIFWKNEPGGCGEISEAIASWI